MMQQCRELLLLVPVCCFPHTSKSLGHALPSLCPVRVGLFGVPLGRTASLHDLRQELLPFVRSLRWVLPVRPIPRWRSCWPYSFSLSPAGPAHCCRTPPGPPGSRAWNFQACLGSGTARDSFLAHVYRQSCYCLPPRRTASAPRSRGISQLNTLPACAPVNASLAALRRLSHDSGSGWFVIPFL